MGFFEGLFISKEEREKRDREYLKKIFPYGEKQKQKVQDILYAFTDKKHRPEIMMHYILIKEGMIDSESKDYDSVAKKIEKMKLVKLTSEQKACIRLLIFIDPEIDENLNYPTPDELKAKAAKEGGNSNG
ncbi:MAG TPA: hypothetical protein PK304_06930 [Mobilitalea sp.]|nr:hypothetical protein [Mobilitalea sp.]